jgi:hypothetical protein
VLLTSKPVPPVGDPKLMPTVPMEISRIVVAAEWPVLGCAALGIA